MWLSMLLMLRPVCRTEYLRSLQAEALLIFIYQAVQVCEVNLAKVS